MEYCYKKGMQISKLTLGTVQLGMEYGIANQSGKPDADKSEQILDRALKGGINCFDTARAYGDSEQILGRYFSEQPDCCSPIFMTKFELDQKYTQHAYEIEKQIYHSVENSLEALHLAKIPVLLMHDPKSLDSHGKTIAAILKKMILQNLIGCAGVSVYTTQEAEQMLRYDVFEAVQLPMNVMDQRFKQGGLLKKLYEKDILVFVRSVFLKGLFFMEAQMLPPQLKEAVEPLAALNRIASGEGISTAQLALSYIRDLEGVTSLVVGAETPQQINNNIGLMDAPCLSEKCRSKLEQVFAEIPVHILNPSLWGI